ncbi:MAG: PorP/SprF family type IX secretion system membrane protein [Bacteroidota bacterium]
MLRHLLFVLLLVMTQSFAFGQDPSLSQYYAIPQQINPALTGLFDGQFRLMANYKDQLGSVAGPEAYETLGASFDMRLPLGRYDYAGIGVNFMRDEAGVANFNRLSGALGFSFQKQLGGGRNSSDNYLVGGVQAGFGQWGFDPDKVWYSSQFDPLNIAINEAIPSGENFEGQSTRFFVDMAAGVLWYSIIDDHASVYIGGSAYHLNSPNIAFLDQDNVPLDRRFVVHAGGEVPLNESISLLPVAIFMQQGPFQSVTAGSQLKYYGERLSDMDMKLGIWLRGANSLNQNMQINAIIIAATLDIEAFSFGLSYDFTQSNLGIVNNARGGLELFVGYTFGNTGRSYSPTCPSF